jgi:hypothetical protein
MPFIVRGSHNTVTPCTLPNWLPGHIVDSMNMHFGNRLRGELIDLMNRTGFLRRRTQSTGSGRLSSDSYEEQAEGMHVPMAAFNILEEV